MDKKCSGPKSKLTEIEKTKSYIVVEINQYLPHSLVIKTNIKKSTDNLRIRFFDSGEGLTKKTSPSDAFIQVIESEAEVIDGVSRFFYNRNGTIIPAHLSRFIDPNKRFKIIQTINIKVFFRIPVLDTIASWIDTNLNTICFKANKNDYQKYSSG